VTNLGVSSELELLKFSIGVTPSNENIVFLCHVLSILSTSFEIPKLLPSCVSLFKHNLRTFDLFTFLNFAFQFRYYI